MKKLYVFIASLLVTGLANAASVLDTASKTAVESGFGDIRDTFLDVITTAWPFLLGIIAITMAPRIVKRIAKMF